MRAGSHRLASMPSPDRASEVLPLSFAAARRAGLGRLRHTVSTGSTNDDLAREARAGDRSPAVLVTDHQTAGKGRLGRRWLDLSPDPSRAEVPGGDALHGADVPDLVDAADAANRASGAAPALLVSFRMGASAAQAFDCAFAVSAAALEAVAEALAGQDARVRSKWPNDLLVEAPGASGKLAGVLSEFVEGVPGVAVVGLGLNLTTAPSGIGATSLSGTGGLAARDELLAAIIETLPIHLSDPARARAVLATASATIGRKVKVERTDGTSVTGIATGLDDAGRLVVTVGGREVPIDAGDVFHLR